MFKRHACVRQQAAADCGAACLATVLRHFEVDVSVSRIREYARTDQRGTTVLGLVEAARQLGFDARGVKAALDALPHVALPCIAHVVNERNPHYVVVHQVGDKHIVVADPAEGVRRMPRSEFLAAWTGILVLVTPRCDLFDAGVAVRKRARMPVLQWLLPHTRLLAGAATAAFLFTALGMAGSVFLQLLVDRVVVRRDSGTLWGLALVVGTLYLLRAGIGLLRGVLLARIGQKIDAGMMLDYFRHLLRLPMRFFETRTTGEILARFNDIVKVRDALGGSAIIVLVDAATMVAGFCFLFHYNTGLACLSVLVWTLPLLAACSGNAALRRSQRRTVEQAAGLQSWLVESLAGIATLKALSAEENVYRRSETRIRLLLDSIYRSWVVAGCANAAGEACSSVAAVSVLACAAALVLGGRMTPGEMVAFYSILSLMLQPVQRLIGVNQAVQDAVIAAERLDDTMDLEQETHAGMQPEQVDGAIEFREVSFGYGMGAPVLRSVSFAVPSHSITALIGPSGSGKSTIAKLLLRFYPAQSGTIELDGQDISRLDIACLRRNVRYVGPDAFLFSGTVRENLSYADPEAEPDAMRDVLCMVGLRWLTLIPDYLDLPVGERGVGLSGGQRQQLSIARALLGRPGVLILDEATSNVDSVADAEVMRHIRRMRDRMTVVVIDHAVRPGLDPDHVVTIDAGVVGGC